MNQPLGCAVGNALEVKESIDTLHGHGPRDFNEHCLFVASHMLHLGEKAADLESARKMAIEALASGMAFEYFRKLVELQGGDVAMVDNPDLLPRSEFTETVFAERSGFLREINAREVGETAVNLGAGRVFKEDKVDPGVGIMIHHKVGDTLCGHVKPIETFRVLPCLIRQVQRPLKGLPAGSECDSGSGKPGGGLVHGVDAIQRQCQLGGLRSSRHKAILVAQRAVKGQVCPLGDASFLALSYP